jgi:ABC-type spermidine/putrescine transport system permease subunit I
LTSAGIAEAMMKKPEWYDVLEPREAVIAGVVGIAIAVPLTSYAYHAGYPTAWGLTRGQWKEIGTATWVVGFAIPYWVVKWWVKRQ